MAALGSDLAMDGDVTLIAYNLPPNVFGFFLASQVSASVAQPGGSLGVLYLGSPIARYVGPGQVLNSGSVRHFLLPLGSAQE